MVKTEKIEITAGFAGISMGKIDRIEITVDIDEISLVMT